MVPMLILTLDLILEDSHQSSSGSYFGNNHQTSKRITMTGNDRLSQKLSSSGVLETKVTLFQASE